MPKVEQLKMVKYTYICFYILLLALQTVVNNQFTCVLLDVDYKKFLELYNGDEEKFPSNPETLLEEIEAKTKELSGEFQLKTSKPNNFKQFSLFI